MRKAIAIAPLLLAIASAPQAQAEQDNSTFALGIGASSEKSIYRGVGRETDALPILIYENGSFFIQGPSIGYNFVDTDQVKVAAFAEYRGEGYAAKDSAFLAGMKDRDGAFEVGVSASYENHYGEWSVSAQTDASSTHKGYEVGFGWEQQLELSENWSLTPEAGISYRSADLNNYYYGVKASEATANRAAYKADAGLVYELGVSADYRITPNQMLHFGAGYTVYGSEISDSSIVEDDKSTELRAAYLYRF